MGARKARTRRARIAHGRSPGMRVLDATPERLAKSDYSETVNPAEIDSSEQPIGRTRRFRDSWIDRLHRRGLLTYAQWHACDWYAKTHARAFAPPRVVADYGRSCGGGDGQTYGYPQSEAQAAARATYRAARATIPAQMVVMVEAVVLHDDVPRFLNGRQRGRYAARIADAVQPLAVWLCAPGA